METRIEKIKSDDIDEIIKLGLSAPELQVDDNKSEYYSKVDLESFIKSPDDLYLVAKIGGKIAGYILAIYNPYLKECYLIDIFVKKEYRGLGVGQLIYKKMLEELKKKGYKWVWSLVHEDNKKMMEFSEKQGFTRGRKFYIYHKELE